LNRGQDIFGGRVGTLGENDAEHEQQAEADGKAPTRPGLVSKMFRKFTSHGAVTCRRSVADCAPPASPARMREMTESEKVLK